MGSGDGIAERGSGRAGRGSWLARRGSWLARRGTWLDGQWFLMAADPVSSIVGLVTVTYSPGPVLAGMLDSLAAAYSGELRIILADNGSTDGSVERAAGRPGVRLVRTGGNLGYGGGANAGVRALDPEIDWVIIANPDLVFTPHAIDRLLDCADRHPAAGAFGPLITTPDGVVYPSARNLPSITDGVGHALCGWWWPTNPWTRRYRLDAQAPTERIAGWLSGSCLLVRRAAFEQVGGFDEAYFMYFEDVDLGDRMARAGWASIYCPSARVSHEGGHATEREPGAMAQAHHRSAYRYLATRHPARWQAPLRWVLKAGLGARALLARRLHKVAAGAELPDRHVSGAG